VDEKSETEFEQSLTAEPHRGLDPLGELQLSAAIKDVQPSAAQLKALHTCIKDVTEMLDGLRFNTAISAQMIFINDAITWETKPAKVLRDFLVLLHPFAPHLAEELWSKLATYNPGQTGSVQSATSLSYTPWPSYDPALLIENTLQIPVQVNGKLRDVITVGIDASQAEIEAAAKGSEKAKSFVDGKTIKKIIVVPKKLVNIVVG